MPFLTGDDASTTVDISLTLPDDLHLLAAVIGQLTSLTYLSAWEQDGTALPAQRVDEMREAIANIKYAPGGDMLVPSDRMPDYIFIENYGVGVNAGTFPGGPFLDRNLNTIALNRDGLAELDLKKFNVPSGTYWLYAFGLAYRVGQNTLRIEEAGVAGAITPAWPVSAFAATGDVHSGTKAELWVHAALTSAKEYVLRHRCATTQNNNGLGRSNVSDDLNASGVMMWRVD